MADTNKQTSAFGRAFSFLGALCPDRNQVEESKHAEADRTGAGTAILAQATTELDFPETDGCMWYKPPLSSREEKAQSLPQPRFSVKTIEQKPS